MSGAAGAAGAAAAASSRAPQEDVGYETAKLKGVDVVCQLAVMLRQRGLRIVRVVDVVIPPEEPNAAPMSTPPDAAASSRAEHWMLSVLAAVPSADLLAACAPTAGPLTPVLVAQIVASEAPPGTAARLHLDRGLARDRDTTVAFVMPAGRINVKQLRVVREAIEAAPETPARVIVAAREKIQPAALEVLRIKRAELNAGEDDGRPGTTAATIAEKFMLSELTYNPTRHYLVPKHRLCSPEEVAALKRRFPKLALQARDDAISRFHGLLPGDVVVYHRRRAVGLGGDYYREVI